MTVHLERHFVDAGKEDALFLWCGRVVIAMEDGLLPADRTAVVEAGMDGVTCRECLTAWGAAHPQGKRVQ